MAGFKDKRDLNRYQRSGLASSGRSAGMGILYDRYDEAGRSYSLLHKQGGSEGDMTNTESKLEQVPEEILREITEMHKRYREIYADGYRIAGIDSSYGVQLASQAFLDTFGEYELERRSNPEYPLELFAEFNGVRVFTIISKDVDIREKAK